VAKGSKIKQAELQVIKLQLDLMGGADPCAPRRRKVRAIVDGDFDPDDLFNFDDEDGYVQIEE